jgi:RNA polymerase sigma-70 factor (ECF subfamily)
MADDLTQEVYLRAMRSLRRFRGDSSARTWLLAIARHQCIDAIRSQRRQQRLIEAVTPAGPVPADHSADFHDILQTLDRDQRSAFLLTQLLGLTYEDAANVCECAVGTIRSRVARARERLVVAVQHPSFVSSS